MANLNKSGVVFDIQSFSLHDGPGIRTLIFLKGCPLKCLWCANPEGQNIFPEVRYHSLQCTSCLECANVCPNNAITTKILDGKTTINIDRKKCSICKEFKCIDVCPNDALKITGKHMTIEEIMKVVKRDFPYYRGKGGITLSGGDPIYQHEFAIEILKACKEEYINTAIESSMFSTPDIIEKFIPFTDLFLTDIKHMNSDTHKKLTGVGNELILKNISKVAKTNRVLVRVPLIPNMNDDDENILETASFCRENGITRINILPYHKLGQIKYTQLSLEYPMPDINSPKPSKLEHIKQCIEKLGVKCIIG